MKAGAVLLLGVIPWLLIACDVQCLRKSDCGAAGQCVSGVCSGQSTTLDAGIISPVFVDQETTNDPSVINNGAGGATMIPVSQTLSNSLDAGTELTPPSGILDASRF